MNSDHKTTQPEGTGDDNRLAAAFEELLAGGSARGGTLPESGACPEPGEWLRLACDEVHGAEADALVAHAAACAACAVRMRLSMQTLAGDAGMEDALARGEMESYTPEWQHRLAVELAHTPRRTKSRKFTGLLVWAGAGLAATVLLAVGVVWWQHENSPEHLLAEAYTQSRTFDLRMPEAGYAQVTPNQHLRGGAMDNEQPRLLEARARIERQLQHSPQDPHLLQMEARADVLAEQYDSAIDILDRLVAAGPVTPGLLLDDASAYFQRGTATGSENDRATALDYLRRADEMAPDDPVVLFNEALVMEDRGQVMNAVETWNRYLNFERDPRWLAEGQRRLSALQETLNRIKSHSSRMEQHLATPQAMRALAADATALRSTDEELTTTLLPQLLRSAYPPPVERSRGSPCGDGCMAARELLHSLADSLERNHQDSWLTDFLLLAPQENSDDFEHGVDTLAKAIDANTQGNYAEAQRLALQSRVLFHRLGNAAGEDRAEIERVFALQRSFTFAPCQRAARQLLSHQDRYTWIRADATALDAGCDWQPGTEETDATRYQAAVDVAHKYGYMLLELRARNLVGSTPVEQGDTESAWRMNIESLRLFYKGDYPAFRAATTMAGLALIEDATPRVYLDLLLNREAFALFSLSENHVLMADLRVGVIRAAIRAGALQLAQQQMAIARKEFVLAPNKKGLLGTQAESELLLAGLYLDRGDLTDAGRMLDDAHNHMEGEDNSLQLSKYAVLRGELELAQGHPATAESTLRQAILREEAEARGAGAGSTVYARQNRDLYAALAGVWLAQGRPGLDILALWERYRLRILGRPVPTCKADGLDCLRPALEAALKRELPREGQDWLVGQVVLRDRVLLYRATAGQAVWREVRVRRDDLLAASDALERAASSPASSQAYVDQAAGRLGSILMASLHAPAASDNLLLLEPDPLLGNVPWPSVATADGPLGLSYNLQEAPSVLLAQDAARRAPVRAGTGQPLIVGAPVGAGQSEFLPEALNEARAVARFGRNVNLLLASQATEAHVAAHLPSASIVHFAGHAAQYDGATRLLLAPANTAGDRPYLDSSLFRKDPPREAQLVVFSACSSGKREEGWDHGMGDIVDTLASLGVPEVVATRWRIDSASAVPMMSAFYRGLASGMSVPEALTAARRSLIRDARYSHPYYWAAYYASGVGNTDLREVLHEKSR